MKNAFEINFSYADMMDYCAALASLLGVPSTGNAIHFPAHIAQGYIKFFKINDYLSYLVGHYTPVQPIVFNRCPTAGNNIAIAFRNFSFQKIEKPFTEHRVIELNKHSLGSIYCKDTRLPEKLVIQPGQEIKVITVLLKEDWLHHILRNSEGKEKISRYILGQQEKLNLRKEFLSPEQNKIFSKIFAGNNCFLMEHLFYDGRVLNLLESFFKEVMLKEEEGSQYLFPSYDDISAVQRAEQYILENLSKPFPGVEVLSRLSCMSRTKFINLFQKVYGISSFEYSQQKRLARAFEYLKTGRYSVSDVADMIGYAGINNFVVAFKKEFRMSPTELLENIKAAEIACMD